MNLDLESDFDIAIVGYGPVGATLANLLGPTGFRVAVFEREPSVFHQPRASHLDGEVMRVCQTAGLSEPLDQITIGAKGFEFLNAKGEVLLNLSKPEGKGPHGWNHHYRFYQPTLEKTLRSGVDRFDNIKVYLNHDVLSIAQNQDQTNLQVENKQDGTIRSFSSSYVVGCDGGRSLVRNTMNAALDDIGLHQQWLVIDIKLRRPVDLPKIGIQYCNPAHPVTFVPMIGDYDRFRWEMMLMPGEQKEEMERPERVWELLSPWVKPQDAELERAAVYIFHSVIASDWRKGRMLIAGDSVHQTPPFLGQGMCAGIRDVANLAWKLEMVVNGKANDSLLDTYQSERSPHVHAFIDMAAELGKIITVIDPQEAAERDKELLEGPIQTLIQPEPRLGPGLSGEGDRAGAVFPQPQLNNGRRLDDVLGFRFAVIGDASVMNDMSAEAKRFWENVEAAVLTDCGGEINRILSDYGVRVIILRPDRYVLGTASTAAELNALTYRLATFFTI